ncbi:hypothetical protein B6U79_04425 [Candidatus Bathyarchaeota archaeon ex4484_231]|nr:MAG: hypothetical protein B6U79_04425 [Candidatus Bathyarchaeota archaeon ex4484_231]
MPSQVFYLYLARLFCLFFFSRRIRFFFHLALMLDQLFVVVLTIAPTIGEETMLISLEKQGF